MTKLLIAFLLVFANQCFAQNQIDLTGFGEIRIGKTYDELKSLLVEVEEAPENAWFAPMTLDEFLLEFGDTVDYYGMLEANQMMAEELNSKEVLCTLKGAKNNQFLGHTIACINLVFQDDVLTAVMLVLDPSTITEASKRKLLVELEAHLGELLCSYSADFDPAPFECSSYSETGQFTISDMAESAGEPGETINISFGF
jgi:hypothetical protein